ncbi:MAG: hypothetical protein LBF74_13545 [Treponema sp.]|jgi:hypothetical protein|nr:hypothetical protein [Treponema sp.]
MNKEKIEELKKEYPAGIYEGAISFNDIEGKLHTVEFVYRIPLTADVEAHSKVFQRNPIVANLNLLQSLIVHPEPGPIIEEIREYPTACGRFVDDAISPFFGANVSVRSRKL